MKILVACFLLSALGLTYATPLSLPKNYDDLFEKFFIQPNKDNSGNLKPKESDEISTLLQSSEDDEGGDEDIATLQGVFNVLALIESEKDKVMNDKDAMVQFWRSLGRNLWKAGKRFLKRRYCSEELEVRAMLEELVGEQEMPEEDNQEREGEALAELQSLFNALKTAEAKVMQDGLTDVDKAKMEGWWSRVKRWANGVTRRVTRKHLC